MMMAMIKNKKIKNYSNGGTRWKIKSSNKNAAVMLREEKSGCIILGYIVFIIL